MPAHLGILYPPSLCNNLRIISQFYFFIFFFFSSGADGAVWNKNTEAFPAPRWPLREAQPLRQDTERRLACAVVLVSLCYQSPVHRVTRAILLPILFFRGKPCIGKIWQKIQKRGKCGKIAAGLIMESGMREIQ